MKRSIALRASVPVLALAVLTGCGSDGGDAGATTTSGSSGSSTSTTSAPSSSSSAPSGSSSTSSSPSTSSSDTSSSSSDEEAPEGMERATIDAAGISFALPEGALVLEGEDLQSKGADLDAAEKAQLKKLGLTTDALAGIADGDLVAIDGTRGSATVVAVKAIPGVDELPSEAEAKTIYPGLTDARVESVDTAVGEGRLITGTSTVDGTVVPVAMILTVTDDGGSGIVVQAPKKAMVDERVESIVETLRPAS